MPSDMSGDPKSTTDVERASGELTQQPLERVLRNTIAGHAEQVALNEKRIKEHVKAGRYDEAYDASQRRLRFEREGREASRLLELYLKEFEPTTDGRRMQANPRDRMRRLWLARHGWPESLDRHMESHTT